MYLSTEKLRLLPASKIQFNRPFGQRPAYHGVMSVLPPVSVALLACVLALFTHPAWLLLTVFGVLDARGRHRDFVYLASQEYLSTRLADFYGKSFCGRHVVTTISPFWRAYYKERGYRWFHICPQGFPLILFRPSFWWTFVKGHRV